MNNDAQLADEGSGGADDGQYCDRVFGALRDLLCTLPRVDVLGFGTFRVRPYRPARPARMGDHSFVEAPYLGPIEFLPGALLLRQLEQAQVDRSVVVSCDPLYTALRNDGRIPRGKIPGAINFAFRQLTDALISRRMANLPSIGSLLVRQRPGRLELDGQSNKLLLVPVRPAMILRVSREMLDQLPIVGTSPLGKSSDESTPGDRSA